MKIAEGKPVGLEADISYYRKGLGFGARLRLLFRSAAFQHLNQMIQIDGIGSDVQVEPQPVIWLRLNASG